MKSQLATWETAWRGHEKFATWLVKHMNLYLGGTIVDLGVGQGFSTFVFALASKGIVYGIDSFTSLATLARLRKHRDEMHVDNLSFLHGDINSFGKIWTFPIDILHIDATHDYDAVKRDFEQWRPHVKDEGVILMHDTISYLKHAGKFFDEIEGYYKFNIEKSEGLGVLSKSRKLIEECKEHARVD